MPLFALSCAARPAAPSPSTAAAPPPPAHRAPPARALANDPEPAGRLPAGVEPLRYALELEIVPRREAFRGAVDIRVRLDAPRDHVWLHGTQLAVTRAEVRRADGRAVPARWEPGSREGINALRWAAADAVGPGEATLHLEFSAPFDRTLQSLYRVDSGGDSYAFTQFEDIHARRAFPCFDEPRFKTPFDVTLVIERDHRAITNTLELPAAAAPADAAAASDAGAPAALRRVRFAPTEPLPTYLLAWAVGPLDIVEAPPIAPGRGRTRPLPFRGVAARGRGAALARALADTPAIVRALEDYFDLGYPYPKLDVIAVPDFGAGAMENAGAITFRESLLLLRDDAPADQRRAMRYVMAHELAHHWFGDLVTLRWWDDIWLNESFATWMGARVTAEVYPADRQPLSLLAGVQHAMRVDSLASTTAIRRRMETDADLRGGSSAIVYQKGAAVLGMFERWIGADAFRDALRAYMRAHAHAGATSADLFSALSRAAGRPVEGPFRTFVDQPGVPLVAADLLCDGRSRLVTLAQRRFVLPAGAPATTPAANGDESAPPAPRWQIPVCVRYPDGAPGAVRERCTLVTGPRAEIDLGPGTCPAWVMPNAEARGYFRWSLPPARHTALVERGWAALSPAERLSVLSNARAAFSAGALDAAAMRPLVARAAADPERLVATEPFGWWTRVITDELTPAAAERARREVARLYAPAFARLGWAQRPGAPDDAERALYRRDLVAFLGLIAREPRVRAEGARRGGAYLGGAGASVDPAAVPPELAGAAMAAYLNDARDAAAVDAVVARALASDDAVVRFRLLGALGWTADPLLAARALPVALEPRVRVNELFTALDVALDRGGDARDAAFGWLEANADRLFARISRDAISGTPALGSRFCSREAAERVRAFFAPRVAQVPGGARNLTRALEAVGVCAAERDAQRASLEAAFAR